MDGTDEAREAIHAAIQEHAPKGEKAILTGWALVTEWMDHDGERWLSRSHAAATPSWSANGMHHEALYGNWGTEDPD